MQLALMIEPGPVSNLGRLGEESWNKLLSQRSSWLSIPPYMCILLQSMRDWNANTLDWKALDRAFQSRIFMEFTPERVRLESEHA